jgi:hypothetical protein
MDNPGDNLSSCLLFNPSKNNREVDVQRHRLLTCVSHNRPCLDGPPPPIGSVRDDVALFSDERHMGWGVVIQDHTHAFLLSCSEGGAGYHAPEHAKTLGVR